MEPAAFQRRFREHIASDPGLDALPELRLEIAEFVAFCVFQTIVDGVSAGSWTVFQTNVDGVSA